MNRIATPMVLRSMLSGGARLACGLFSTTLIASVSALMIAPAGAQVCEPAHSAVLLADDPGAGDQMGDSCALHGSTAILGAPSDDGSAGTNSGSAYIFIRQGNTWLQQARLRPVNGGAFDRFGQAVDIDFDTAIVGAPFRDEGASDAGAAYIFDRLGSTWLESAKLLPPNPQANMHFGSSVAVSGDTAIVGASGYEHQSGDAGIAHVYTRSGGAWTLQDTLIPQDRAGFRSFGRRVALDDDTAAVLAIGSSGDRIRLYIFQRVGDTWFQRQRIDIPNQDPSFSDLALDGDTIMLSNWVADSLRGVAWVYRRGFDGLWFLEATLTPQDDTPGLLFGASIALDGNLALAGAPSDDIQVLEGGSAFLFVRTGATWTQQARLLPPTPESEANFGLSCGLSGNRAVVASPFFDIAETNAGAGFVYELGCGICPADMTGDGIADGDDYFTFLDLFASSHPAADLTGDGVVDADDYFFFLDLFTQGC